MDAKKFLKTIADYTLVTQSLLNRVYAGESLRDIDKTLKELERAGLVRRHEYTGFACVSLTEAGFKALGINYSPKYDFAKWTARRVCFVNQLRHGITEEINGYGNISLERWVSGRKFAGSPLVVKVGKEEQEIRPEGLAILKHNEIYRLYFIHYWHTLEQIRADLFLYYLYQESKNHIKRFFLSDKAALRVLCLLPYFTSEKEFLDTLDQMRKYLKMSKGGDMTLFLTVSKTRLDSPLSSEIWRDAEGNKRSVI